MQSNQFRRKRRANKNVGRGLLELAKRENNLSLPPAQPYGRFSTSIRYSPATATGCSFTQQCALNLLCCSLTTTTAVNLIEAVKLRKLHIWVPGFTVTSTTAVVQPTVNVSIRDFGTVGLGVEREFQLQANGSEGNYFCYKFRGWASEWFNKGVNSEVIFALGVTGCIPVVQLDFSCQLVQSSGGMSAAAGLDIGTTIDTTTAGVLFYAPLNSLVTESTEGAGTWLPIGAQTATVNMPRPLPVIASSSIQSTPGSCCCSKCVSVDPNNSFH